MTSRMAVSYPGLFRALAVHSASMPLAARSASSRAAGRHPDLVFLHGLLDPIVPLPTMESYRNTPARWARSRDGHQQDRIAPVAAEGAQAVRDWFDRHP